MKIFITIITPALSLGLSLFSYYLDFNEKHLKRIHLNFVIDRKINILINRVTHKGWDGKDDMKFFKYEVSNV